MPQTIDLVAVADSYQEKIQNIKKRIIICAGTGCMANGSLKVFHEFEKCISEADLDVVVELKEESKNEGILLSESGCQGFCQMGPLVTILPDDILYTKVKPSDVSAIVEKTVKNHELIKDLLYAMPSTGDHCKGVHDIPFYTRQHRFVLKNCGVIDPENIEEYIHLDGYKAAEKCYTASTPVDICKEILFAGLRGRGGGGFPTGRKWELTRVQPSEKKYVICNGDEGDPGAFMDRSVMEGNPHSVIEGIMIAACAIGADEAYVYVRAEYPLAVKRVRKAVKDAMALGLLGENIFNSGKNLNIEVMEGAGAFVCGEETALIASIEGKRGMPSPKPPFPAVSGLYGKPTVINNVETLATVPLIINMGAEGYLHLGNQRSPGTKTFALTGHVANTGLIEVPFGTTLNEVVNNIGGGITNNDGSACEAGFKAVQIGGPSGGCLTPEHLKLTLDFDSLTAIGSMIGSGGLVVMNQQTCMIQVARFFMQFTQNESCGKCVLCREGTKQMLALLDDIIEGRATMETLDLLEKLALAVKKGSLCGLGKTAPNPILSTLKHFRQEYIEHVEHKYCSTKNCKHLIAYEIDPDKCKGCMVCIKKCPVGAITGERKQVHKINLALCIKCGACAEACRLDAISGGN
ncbi:MAG: NADH-ubiquinone oxidoreductase-F iron-sulfur binding region domain-containing protein [Bacteroidota bacterium]|nr:NADH-ubiquinone oxidoreductase-F iron-sulfur binding region domain-containing protein [Bacteroidota bacterium]